jgi:SPW repeat
MQPPINGSRDWRQDVVGVDAIVVVLGLWLIASPFVLGYATDDATWNPVISGTVAIMLAVGQTTRRVRSMTPGWILMVIGVWLFASGFWLGDSSQASWNALGAGTLMFFLGSVSAAATQRGGNA